MSLLTLIRHGQATAFQKESDRLSELGEWQARALARFWLKSGIRFDEVFTGTLIRQTRTEQIVARCYQDARALWPPAIALPGFNEYDAAGVIDCLVPLLASRDKRFAALVDDFESARNGPDRNRPFQRMFEIAMQEWLRDSHAQEQVEPWPAFRERVAGALRQVTQGSANRRVAVFTSGGPIALAVQRSMHAPDQAFLEINWRIRNCSLTEFVFSGERFTLDSFNAVAHLEDSSRWSYR